MALRAWLGLASVLVLSSCASKHQVPSTPPAMTPGLERVRAQPSEPVLRGDLLLPTLERVLAEPRR